MDKLGLPACDDRRIWDVWMSSFHFPALTAADDLGLFPFLAERAATVGDVARRFSLSPTAAEALLGVLTSLGFLVQRAGRFHLTEVARSFLLPASAYYWGGALRFFREIAATHEAMRDALLKDATNQPQAGHQDTDDAQSRTFTHAMHGLSFPAAMGVALRGDFSGVRRLLDVGGGSGCFCIALALRHPAMRLTVLDTPSVCPVAAQYVADYGLQDRIDTLALDMSNDPWPSGYDAVFFSNIFHGTRDAGLALARRTFEALPPGGRIFIHEMLLDDTKDGPRTATSFSLAMHFFNQRGKQYTAGELGTLLQEAGFVGIDVVPTYGYYSLLSGTRP
jgi:hypothetical protein